MCGGKEQCSNDLVDQSVAQSAAAPRNIVDVDDDEREEEDEEKEEGGEGKEEEVVEGAGVGRFCLGQEHDCRAVRKREGSELPPDYQSNYSMVVEPAHRKTYKPSNRDMFPLLMLCCCFMQGRNYRKGLMETTRKC